MIGFIWNSRGLNRPDKLTRAGDLIRENHPDFISLYETKKENFTTAQLQVLDPQDRFTWNWLPATGTTGGILASVNGDIFDVISRTNFNFCISCVVKNKQNGDVWRFMSVYGTAYEEHKLEFITELHNAFAGWTEPTLVGDDFNLIRQASDKS